MKIKVASKVCRVCLDTESNSICILTDATLLEQFEYLTNKKISEQDKGLPTRLCSDCIGRLKTAFDFKYQCLEAEKFLITYINEANQKLDEKLKAAKSLIESKKQKLKPTLVTTLEIDSTNHSINRGSTTTVVTVVAHNEVEPTTASVVENRNVETECDDSTLFYITEAEDDAVDQDDSVDHDPDQYSSYMDVDYLDDANEIPSDVGDDRSLNAFICDICGDEFADTQTLRRHINVHVESVATTEKQPDSFYECSHCGRKFSTRRAITHHLNVMIRSPEICRKCRQRFCDLATLNAHDMEGCSNKPHNGDNLYKCPFRQQHFNTKLERDNHIEYDDCSVSAIEYKCQQCDLLFGTDKLLKCHQRAAHSKQTYYKCDLCDRDFRRQSWLNSHVKQHSMENFTKIEQSGWNKPLRKFLTVSASRRPNQNNMAK